MNLKKVLTIDSLLLNGRWVRVEDFVWRECLWCRASELMSKTEEFWSLTRRPRTRVGRVSVTPPHRGLGKDSEVAALVQQLASYDSDSLARANLPHPVNVAIHQTFPNESLTPPARSW